MYPSRYRSSYHYTIWTTFAQHQTTEHHFVLLPPFGRNVLLYFPFSKLVKPNALHFRHGFANSCTRNASLCWRPQLKFFLNTRDQQLKRRFAYKITWIINMLNLILLLILNKYIVCPLNQARSEATSVLPASLQHVYPISQQCPQKASGHLLCLTQKRVT